MKSAIVKMIKKFRTTGSLLGKNRNREKSVLEINGHHFQHLMYLQVSCVI